MFSGGLDSILAAKIMLDEGFEVIALHFYTGFNEKLNSEISRTPHQAWIPRESVVNAADNLGVKFVTVDVSNEYIPVIIHPEYQYGSGVNPCIDCRIFLLKRAREFMENEHAILVFTGEVLGQRPMSQHRQTLKLIEKKAGLEGRLLRPLSAKLLNPTIPEREGIINREHLLSLSGRSRKPQQQLAKEFGIDVYPQPAGGCILTEKSFSRKYTDLINHTNTSDITLNLLHSLKAGRHLRLTSGIKIIVGRNELENKYLGALLSDKSWEFDVLDFPGALVFTFGEPSEDDFLEIAGICARYSKALTENTVAVIAKKGNKTREFIVKPAEQDDIDTLLIR